MTNSSLEQAAQRRVARFEYKYCDNHGEAYGKNLLYLACHAALPAALNPDFVHLLRINFFFENTEQLPYTAEADLLLSSLCTEIGNELYEMDHEVRDILLQKLAKRYGGERIGEVAKLLWQYDQRFAPWVNRDMLERAQQLTALSFISPPQARLWLAQQATDQYSIEQRVWFTAVNRDVVLAEKLLPFSSQRTETALEIQATRVEENQTQSTPVVPTPRSNLSEEPIQAETNPVSDSAFPLSEEEAASVDGGGRIPAELYNRLVTLLSLIPGIDDFHRRSTLIESLPNHESIARGSSSREDLSLLVSQLLDMYLADGQSALLVFIDNVILFSGDTMYSEQLKELRHQLEAVYRRRERALSMTEEISGEASSQTESNASEKSRISKKTSSSKEEKPPSGSERVKSEQGDSQERMRRHRESIEVIERIISEISPRKFTLEILSQYEEEISSILQDIKKSPKYEFSPLGEREAVLENIIKARDEISLAIIEFSERGVNRSFISAIRKAGKSLENALEYW